MSQDIDDAFIRQYETDVHVAYQRMGSKMRNSVRNKSNVKGKSTTFQKVGKGEASTKTRHGDVPVMNVDHTPVECTLYDYYAGDFVDALDELKINIDERKVIVDAGAYALGRKTDSLITTAMEGATIQVASTLANDQTTGSATGMNVGKFRRGFEELGENDVPTDDGNVFLAVGVKQWSQLMTFNEFADADYVGADGLVWKGRGAQAKFWNGVYVFMFNGLPVAASVRSCFMYHKTAVGHASGQDIKSDITWQGTKAAHFVNNMMSQGSVLIDDQGIVEILCSEA